ncbi:MAG: cysteine desulfurase [Myxococcota bacterium]|jgi:cysteine desulfurase
MNRTIYLDHHATTPVDPRVLEAMLPYFTEHFGNAASRTHSYGWTAEEAVETARLQVATAIGASPKEIVFTSGATESNNLALKGAIDADDGRNHIITVVTEHKATLDTVDWLESRGARVTRLPVGTSGLIDLAALAEAITAETLIVSVMHANNEIGVLQPIAAIGKLCRERGVLFHTDAAQSIGKVPFDVDDACVDLASISGHKVYGPKGIGALYVRRKPRARVKAQIHGGGHERGHRSGTLAVPLIVGLGVSLEVAVAEREVEAARLRMLRDRLYRGLTDRMSHIRLNGDESERLPGNLNVSIQYVEGEALLMGMSDIAVSSGSACTSDSLEASYVLKAIGVSEQLAHSSIRFGLGRTTTEAEIDTTIERVHGAVQRLREMSPLWDMVKRGEDPDGVEWREA